MQANDPQLDAAIRLHREGRLDEARIRYRQLLAADQTRVNVWSLLATVHRQLGLPAEAIACYTQAVTLAPAVVENHVNLGALLQEVGRTDEARACYLRAIQVDPRSADAHFNLGSLLQAAGHLDEAAAAYRRAVAINPRMAPAWSNLALVAQGQGRLYEAREHLDQALALAPQAWQLQLNQGDLLQDLNEHAAAIAAYDRVLAIQPGEPQALCSRGLAHLTLGQFAQGWADYEHRVACPQYNTQRFPQPRWDGKPLARESLLIHAEQGLGDTLEFIRYVRIVSRLAKNFFVQVQPALVPLLKTSGIPNLLPARAPLPPFDVHAPLLSLPHILGTTLATVPGQVPYLAADPALVAHWRGQLARFPGLKVGIAWQGQPGYHYDSLRSFLLSAFEPLSTLRGVRLFSLQKGPGREQLDALAGRFEVIDLAAELDEAHGPFMDTAAVMMNLDLIISPDTAITHLAGALGVPVWLAMSAAGDWRWLRDRDDSPWYPTIRLFRQNTLNDWAELFERIRGAFAQLQPRHQQPSPHAIGPAASSPSPDELLQQAMALHKSGRFDEACTLYESILPSSTQPADVLHLWGMALREAGKHAEAVPILRRAIALDRTKAPFFGNLATALLALKQTDEALACYQEAARLAPEIAEIHSNVGALLRQMGRLEEARASLETALARDPGYAPAHYNLGNVYQAVPQWEHAIACYRRAVELQPEFVEAQSNLASALCENGQFEESLIVLRRAISQRPNFAHAASNLGVTLQALGRLDEARAQLEQAARGAPTMPEVRMNLGTVLKDLADPAAAVQHFEAALALKPGYAQALCGRGMARLLMGDLPGGFADYEYRVGCPQFDTRDFPQPRWDGSPLAGRTLLIHPEQGIGDCLQFIRYVRLAHARGGRLIVGAPPALLPLFTASGIHDLLPAAAAAPRFDVHIPLMSLPHVLGTELQTIPHDVPYLFADPTLVERWNNFLADYSGLRIGVAWQGRPEFRGDSLRSIPLAAFAPLAAVPGVRLFSLQKGPGSGQIAELHQRFKVVDLGDSLDSAAGPFMDTAAVMKSLDLVITSDTAVAHLAGALGVPVWLALCAAPEWRWLLKREDSPWYPTMRLFRQTTLGNWADVFQRMAAELLKMTGARSGQAIR